MKKITIILLVLFSGVSFSFAQTDDFIVKSGMKGLYIEHKTEPKENFYSIGRLFHVHPRFLAAYNGLDMSKGLAIGQIINIPLTDTNFNRQSQEGAPVYYQSSRKQTVGAVSALSKTPSVNLRKWNDLGEVTAINENTKLIIGYLAFSGSLPVQDVQKPAKEVVATTVREEKKEVETTTSPVKEEIKPEPVANTVIAKKEPEKEEEPSVKESSSRVAVTDEGYFKSFFLQQMKSAPVSKEETVAAGIFKTTSGWNDGKYYALIDGVAPGSVIKVYNPVNNKSVFAKVLGQMSGIRQNTGYTLRISNAAATALQITDMDKFIVKVIY